MKIKLHLQGMSFVSDVEQDTLREFLESLARTDWVLFNNCAIPKDKILAIEEIKQ